MALFIDGEVSSLEDLAGQDSQLLDVASTEGIDVTRKLALAQEEIGLDLMTLLSSSASVDPPFWLALRPNLESVVATPAVKQWHVYRTLELVYEDAYFGQLNDRYQGKRDQFHERAQRARELLIQMGVGMAADPVPRSAIPELETAAGSGLPDGTYYVTTAWLNRAGEEGACAAPAAITALGSALLVHPGTAPAPAAGWNVYIGTAPEALFLQNPAQIATGDTWLQAAEPAAQGQAPGDGQQPSYIQPVPRAIQRG